MNDLKTIILKMFRNNEFYGYQVHKRLISEGVVIETSWLYRVLNQMLKEGLLESRWQKSQRGPKMRVYRLGDEGNSELDRVFSDAIETIHYFYGEYIQGLNSETNPFTIMAGLISRNLKHRNNIVYVTSHPPHGHGVVAGLRWKMPEAKLYLVKPPSVTVDLKLDNLVLLDGGHTSIPLRDSYADLVVVSGLPQKDCMKEALREWRRILSPGGRLAIFAPTVYVKKYKDPLDLGDFMEKYESETIVKAEYLDSELIKKELKTHFQKVEEEHVIHLTIFLAFERIVQ